MREIYKRLFEQKTTYKSALQNHCYKHTHIPFKVDVQILTQAHNNEQNPELWLKQQEYYWICKLEPSIFPRTEYENDSECKRNCP